MPAWRLWKPDHLRQRSERSSTCCSRSTSPRQVRCATKSIKAEVVGRCDCGCPSIDISVPEAVPSAALPDGVVPAELRVTSVDDEPEGDGPTGSTSELATTTSRSGSRRSQQLVSSRLRLWTVADAGTM